MPSWRPAPVLRDDGADRRPRPGPGRLQRRSRLARRRRPPVPRQLGSHPRTSRRPCDAAPDVAPARPRTPRASCGLTRVVAASPLPAGLQGRVVVCGAVLYHPRAPQTLLVDLVEERPCRDEILGRRRPTGNRLPALPFQLDRHAATLAAAWLTLTPFMPGAGLTYEDRHRYAGNILPVFFRRPLKPGEGSRQVTR